MILFSLCICCSCVKGKLVEVNEELVSNPNLMLEKVCHLYFVIIVK